MDAAADRMRYRDALAVREFRALFIALTVSICGSVVSAVALTVIVYQRTGSPLLSSLTFALGFLPYLVGGTLLSAVIDRVPPRRLLVSLDIGCGALVAVMAWPGTAVPLLLVLLAATSTLTSISGGARGGLVRTVVPAPAYVPARSLLRIAAQVAQVGGNAVGGLLLVLLTPSGAILVDAASFVVSAVVMRFGLRVRPAQGAPAGERALVPDSLRGVRAALARRDVRRLLLLGWLVPACAVAPEALAAPYVTDAGGSPAVVGWWLVALPVGMIVGDVVGVWVLTATRQRRLVGVFAAASFVPLLAFVWSPPIVLAIPLLVLSGLGAMYSLGLDSFVRDAVPEQEFGRTMAVNTAGLMTLQGLGFALAGASAELVGAPMAIALAGTCGLMVVALLRPTGAQQGAARMGHTPARVPAPERR